MNNNNQFQRVLEIAIIGTFVFLVVGLIAKTITTTNTPEEKYWRLYQRCVVENSGVRAEASSIEKCNKILKPNEIQTNTDSR